MPENTVYVGRPSKWGNPYRIGDTLQYSSKLIETKEDAVYYFRYYGKVQDVAELAGKNLACWCALIEPCHADVLLKIANRI